MVSCGCWSLEVVLRVFSLQPWLKKKPSSNSKMEFFMGLVFKIGWLALLLIFGMLLEVRVVLYIFLWNGQSVVSAYHKVVEIRIPLTQLINGSLVIEISPALEIFPSHALSGQLQDLL